MTELAALKRDGVRIVRVTFPDLHGVLRGKDVPIDVFVVRRLADGLGFCKAISTVDLRHNVVVGLRARLPRHPRTAAARHARAAALGTARCAWCLAEQTRRRHALRGRPARHAQARDRRASRRSACEPVMGPELEFYLLRARRDGSRRLDAATSRTRRTSTPSATTPTRAACSTACCSRCTTPSLGVIGGRHEYGMSQWEINLHHSDALDAADRAFRFKAAVKELATRDGLLATFMGKPFNGEAGSGFHLHLSLVRRGRRERASPTPQARRACAELLRHFIAGVIDHAPGADGVPQPDRQRLPPHRPARARADARLLGLRQPLRPSCACRPSAAPRPASRCAWRTARPTPTWRPAALLFAGLDGLQRELTPPGARRRPRLRAAGGGAGRPDPALARRSARRARGRRDAARGASARRSSRRS